MLLNTKAFSYSVLLPADHLSVIEHKEVLHVVSLSSSRARLLFSMVVTKLVLCKLYDFWKSSRVWVISTQWHLGWPLTFYISFLSWRFCTRMWENLVFHLSTVWLGELLKTLVATSCLQETKLAQLDHKLLVSICGERFEVLQVLHMNEIFRGLLTA